MMITTQTSQKQRLRYILTAEFHATDEQLREVELSLRKRHYGSVERSPWDSLYEDGQCQFARRSVDGPANIRFHITPEERYAVKGVFPNLDAREDISAMLAGHLDLIKFGEEIK